MPKHIANNENRFDRDSWLVFCVVLVFVVLTLASTLVILSLPTDGWQFPYLSSPPPPLANFAGDWPTPLRAGDLVLTVNGVPVPGGVTSTRLPSVA